MSAPWMITASAREHYLSGVQAQMQDVDVYDIAHALAQANRFSGHAARPYSVAEHSLLVAHLLQRQGATPIVQLAGLLHDAHEAYTGDMASPTKVAIGLVWNAFEDLQAERVRRHFNLLSTFTAHRRVITNCDLIALATERRDLTKWNPARNRLWPVLDTPGREIQPAAHIDLRIAEREQAPWSTWKERFLARYFDLEREVNARGQALMAKPLN
jgi:hypothetical protein